MPTITKFGDRLTAIDTDDSKVPALTTATSARPPIQADYWARNGLHPDARLASAINESANQAVLFRTREVFRMHGVLDGSSTASIVSSSGGAGDRARFRFAFRSGPFSHALGVIVGMVEPDSGTDRNSYARLDIANGAGTVVASQTFVYGSRPISFTDNTGWQYLKQIMGFVDGISADTELFGTFYDVDDGRLQSACVFELPSLSENGGYLSQNITTHSAILDIHRQYPAEVLNDLLQKGASQVFNFTVNNGTAPRTNTSTTYQNLVDDAVTTVSSASPGYTLDMTNRARLSQTSGVPVTMKVYGKVSVGADTATVKLVNSSGVTVLTATTNSTTAGWFSTTGYLPASQDKYDLMFNVTGGATASIYACSVYQYG